MVGTGTRGDSTGIDRNVTGSVDGILNTAIDRGRDVDVFSDARVGTTAVRTTASVACTTLSHRPVFERERGRARVLVRVPVNRTDMCRTDLSAETCRSGAQMSVEFERASEVPTICWG